MPAKVDIRIRIHIPGEIALGPGKAALLEAIHATGSISAAARQLEMSYRRAWQLVDAMNRSFRTPAVATAVGGARRGGATLTPLGQEALKQFRALEAAAMKALRSRLGPLEALLADAAAP